MVISEIIVNYAIKKVGVTVVGDFLNTYTTDLIVVDVDYCPSLEGKED